MTDIVDTLPGAIWQIGWQPPELLVQAHSRLGPTFPKPGEAIRGLALHPDDQAAADAAFRDSATFGSPLRARYRIADGDGWCWVGLHAQPQARAGEGSAPRWHAFVHDASDEAAVAEQRDAALGSERRIREVLDRMPGTVFELRRETDGRVHFTFISDGIRELGGVEPEACRQNPMKMFERIVPEDLKGVIEGIRTGEMGSVIRTYRVRHPDGRLIWVRNFALKRMAADGAMIATCCLQDFTEPMRLQQQLAEARDAAEATERRMREITDNLPGVVFQMHYGTDGSSRVAHVSEGMFELAGIERDAAMTDLSVLIRNIVPEDQAHVITETQRMARESGKLHLEFRFRHVISGDIRWILARSSGKRSADGSVVSNGFWQDITEIKQLESELRSARDAAEAAERRVREITESLPGMVYEIQVDASTRSSRLVYVTDGVAELYGLGRDEAMADHERLLAMTPDEDRERIAQDFLGSQRRDEALVTDYRVHREDGALRWLRTHSRRRDGDGSAVRWVGHTVDVTAEKAVEQELALAKETAEAASRAKSEFLANMSHEIRTPMNAVLSFAYLGLRSADAARQLAYFAKIETAARSLLDIINDVLDLSKIEAGKLELDQVPFALGSLLDNLESVIGLRAQEKGLGFAIHLAPEVPTALVGDPLRLGQVLMNLGGNAVKFTEQGSVEIAVAVEDCACDATTTGAAGRPCRLRFEVRDTGIGLSSEQIGKLFSPFTQADTSTTRRFGGTGLGLSISKRLVELMDGRLSVGSVPGVGSSFCFDAAFSRSDVDAVARTRSDVDEAHLAGLSVLVVDDHAPNLEVARDLLQSAGVQVWLASSGAEAVSNAASQRFDAIFMDMRMPGMDGMEATRRIRAAENGLRVPIIALTANVMAPDRERCLAAGMDDFVGKPIDVEQLFSALARASGRTDSATVLRPLLADVPVSSSGGDEPDHDFERARARVARTPALYERIVERYLNDCDLLPKLRAQIAAGQAGDAAITAHTIKGAAAQLGALRLSRLAAAIETTLATRFPDAAEIDVLAEAQRDARAGLAALLPQVPANAPADSARRSALIDQLQRELEDDEDCAWDTYETLCAALGESERVAWLRLGRMIATLDYPAALDALRAVKA